MTCQVSLKIQLSASYINRVSFYKPDPQYLVASIKEVMPELENVEVVDFMKLGSKNYDSPDVVDNEYLETKMKQAEGLSFKLY